MAIIYIHIGALLDEIPDRQISKFLQMFRYDQDRLIQNSTSELYSCKMLQLYHKVRELELEMRLHIS